MIHCGMSLFNASNDYSSRLSQVFTPLTVIPITPDAMTVLLTLRDRSTATYPNRETSYHQLPVAIWHLERAYEQEPNTGALRDEMKRLYEKRDGVAPERLQVTLGGLADSYVRGRLYEQALSELNKALTQMPDRVDLQLLLTQVLWESDRPVEAAEAALKALDQLPDSIEANRI